MKRVFQFVAVGLIAAATIGCGPAVEYRYRLAAVVDTPEGLKNASSVIKIEVYKSGGLQRQGSQHFYGEAVTIDLGRRGTLFVLLTSPTDSMTIFAIPEISLMPTPPFPLGDDEAYLKNLRARLKVRGVHDVPRRVYPRFVWFRNIADPKSVEEVDPDNLAATFGEGVAFKGLTVELTDEPRTKGRIENVLPWIGNYSRRSFNGRIGSRNSGPLSGQLSAIDFSGEKE